MNFFYLKVLSALTVLLFLSASLFAQIVWTDISADESLPLGVKLIKGIQSSPTLHIWYVEADMSEPSIIVHPYFSSTLKATTTLSTDFGAIAAINAGYFGGTTSVSTLIEPGEIKSQNIAALNRNGVIFPVTRSFFGVNLDRSLTIDWIYHFSNSLNDVYRFDTPTPNTTTTPAPTPIRGQGEPFEQLLMGAGGGPVLIKDGEIRITYDEEVFFGSGINGTNNEPRSAIGFTQDGRVIMMVIDGRSTSVGVTLRRLAEIMLSLDVIEAINLDGGGSTTLAVNGNLINRPAGGTFQRSVPTIIAVVPSDSLNYTIPEPVIEIILDTEMDSVEPTGGGWFATANAGFYGSSPSLLVPIGDGTQFMTYSPELENATYEVYGWWVADPNRSSNTPYNITYAQGDSTVRVNQKLNNGQWVLLGEFEFTGTESDKVTISNNATNGLFVVADALRFVKTSGDLVSTESKNQLPSRTRLNQNYPNPFNPTTNIEVTLQNSTLVSVKVYDLTGKFLQTIYDGWLSAGNHIVQFDGQSLSSGTYIYILESDGIKESRLMTLIK
jgi:hypothetical protein